VTSCCPWAGRLWGEWFVPEVQTLRGHC
jgi:hypothetical protein